MSTAAQPSLPSPAVMERRLYPRIVPRNPVYLTLDGINQSLLLNISENGLLVATPVPLPCKFAALTTIPLQGHLQPLVVKIRVVWTSESRMLAGIRLADLTEYQREQIRKWSGQGPELLASSVSTFTPASAKPAQEIRLTASTESGCAYESLWAEAPEAPDALPSYMAWRTKPLKTGMFLAALLSLVATLWLAPKVYLVREILALLGILALIACIAVSFLLLAMFFWEGLKRGFSFLRQRGLAARRVAAPSETLVEIPECSAVADPLRNS